MSKHKKKQKKTRVKGGQKIKTKSALPSANTPYDEAEQLAEEAQQALKDASTPEQFAAAKALVLGVYDAALKGAALSSLEQASYQHERGYINDEQFQADVDQALDQFNNPGGTGPVNPENAPIYLTLPDGSTIWI